MRAMHHTAGGGDQKIRVANNLGRCPLIEAGPGWETCPDVYRDYTAQALTAGPVYVALTQSLHRHGSVAIPDLQSRSASSPCIVWDCHLWFKSSAGRLKSNMKKEDSVRQTGNNIK